MNRSAVRPLPPSSRPSPLARGARLARPKKTPASGLSDSIRFDAAHGDAHRDGARDFRASPRAMDARTTRVRTRDDDDGDDDDDATHRAR